MNEYVRPEEMEVPQNVRDEFDASDINVGMNAVEEADSANVYEDESVYVPTADPRTLNVVERIGDIQKMYKDGKLPVFVDEKD